MKDPTKDMNKQVLFVDDEPNFLSGIKRMLRPYRDEWDLHFAGGVDEAVALVKQKTYDTIVSDVSMPVKSGLGLLTELSELNVFETTPVIILTGNAEADLKRRALDLGTTDLLNKPVAEEDLVARLNSTLRLKAYRDELQNQNEILEERVLERTADLERARRDIVWRLAKAGEYRDEETGDHVIRVALCSKLLAQALEMSEADIQMIFLTSPLHDVGKIGIPDNILLKPGKLTPEERTIMESHCAIGATILEEAPKGIDRFLELPGMDSPVPEVEERDGIRTMAKEIAMTHHEKWDGSGYPNALVGEDIPVSGQIVAIADVFDALRSTRPYKKAFTFDKTMELMRQGVGKHFAPRAFEAFETITHQFESVRQEYSE
ncbi:MAG: HD domain-containing phosphohydrolase [Candidatus Hydrogenedentota bacterium]